MKNESTKSGNDIRKDTLEATKDLTNLLKKFFEHKEKQYLEKNYIGKVVDNNDPQRLGRCRIRVYGVFEDTIPNKDLPWALPEFDFVGSKKGSFIVPPVDTLVRVYFDDGDIYKPIYTSKVVEQGNQPSDKDTNYPNTMVFYELDGGDKFYIDRSTGNTVFEQRAGLKITMTPTGAFTLEHSKGTILDIDAIGNVDIKSGSDNPLTSINIQSGAAGSIRMQNGTVPCPDLPTCLITGGPLATQTLVPGKQVFIP